MGRVEPHSRQDEAVTLRLRLVLALVALVTVGLGTFGWVVYGLYAQDQHERFDKELQDSAGFTARALAFGGGLTPGGPSGRSEGGRFRPPSIPPPAWAVLFPNDPQAEPIYDSSMDSSTGPDLGPTLSADQINRLRTVPGTGESGDWRVYMGQVPEGVVVVANPLSRISNQLDTLALTGAAGAAGLLGLLAAGSWLILRRGLLPLEHMAASSRAIAAGDLSQRVAPAEDHTEVGQLGLALNTMLDDIEAAFREREATEQRLRQFLADASHELRTPLTSIQGFAELFRLEEMPDRVSLEVILRRIEEESGRMKHLVEDLLLLARLDETRPLAPIAVDLAVLAADACSDAVATAPDRPVTLDAPEPVVVLADQDHLRQAIANLVTNAVRHTPEGSPIEVAAHVGAGSARVEVRDHGPGLGDDALAHVFDRFWQADGARAGRGAGLGLAIVAGIAAEHGGTVSVANAPDGGAVFTMRLPLNGAVA
jgi:two-component system OmpR family sensor kinase